MPRPMMQPKPRRLVRDKIDRNPFAAAIQEAETLRDWSGQPKMARAWLNRMGGSRTRMREKLMPFHKKPMERGT